MHSAPNHQANIIVELMQIAVAAPDVPAAVTPILERLVQDTAAAGAAYFQQQDDVHIARAASGVMPEGPVMDQILTHGLPAETPLMIALQESTGPFFFSDTQMEDTTAGFPGLGVASLAAAPVRDAAGNFVGAFLMHTFERHSWLPEEANLFAATAGALANLTARLVAEERMIEAREGALRALGLALEHRDGETKGHTDRVTEMALAIGQQLNLGTDRQQSLRWGAYLHDIGKVAIPDAILLKPGALTDDEWQVMRDHVGAGHSFAEKLGFLPDESLHLIRHHHERWDGAGYPMKLTGEEIPILARIFSICDVYDALISVRPYKAAWSHQEAVDEILSQTGQQFDPDIVEAFNEIIQPDTTDDEPEHR